MNNLSFAKTIKPIFFALISLSFSANAQIIFETEEFIGENLYAHKVMSMDTADIDGDGDMDILVSSNVGYPLTWYQNNEGGMYFAPSHLYLSDTTSNVSILTDIDGDNDFDIVESSLSGIYWYENLNGLGDFGNPIEVDINTGGAYNSLYAADVDGDGDKDLAAASNLIDELVWYENTNGAGTFILAQEVDLNANGFINVVLSDVDNDTDLDMVSASEDGNTIMWYENIDGIGDFSTASLISNAVDGLQRIRVADINGDTHMDVISASDNDDKIAWYEGDGTGNFGPQQLIGTLNFAKDVFPADIDNDGDLDLMASSANPDVVWYENLNGAGTFGPRIIVHNDGNFFGDMVHPADLDDDGTIDLMATMHRIADRHRLVWSRNTDGAGDFLDFEVISAGLDVVGNSYTADFNGDGFMDVVTHASDGKIAWYRNVDGLGTMDNQIILTIDMEEPETVYADDLDGDGDQDILATSFDLDRISWFENMDGQGNFSEENIISNLTNGAFSIVTADLDNDGDKDVLSTSAYDGEVAWYENDGNGNFGNQQIIYEMFEPTGIAVGDLDNDGDLDVASVSIHDGEVAWAANESGQGSFGPKQTLSMQGDGCKSISIVDLNGDSLMDVLFSDNDGAGTHRVRWMKNNGNNDFSDIPLINSHGTPFAKAADIDNDGDLDVITPQVYYENFDGLGTFLAGVSYIDDAFPFGFTQMHITDIDNNGKLDIISGASGMDNLYLNRNTSILNVNLTNSETLYKVVPNPTNGIVSIHAQTTSTSIYIMNSLGQVLKEYLNKSEIDISTLNNGIYYLKIIDEYGRIEVHKIIKQ